MFCEFLVHYGDPWRAGGIGYAESSTVENADARGVKVILVHGVCEDVDVLFARGKLEAFRQNDDAVLLVVEGNRVGQSGRFYARRGPRPLDGLLEELLAIHADTIIANLPSADRPEARALAQLMLEASIQKGRNRQQYQGDGYLSGDQKISAPETSPSWDIRSTRFQRIH